MANHLIMMMLVPEAWKSIILSDVKEAFTNSIVILLEPWMAQHHPFTDGDYIGAVLDRNGLRPSRYTVTNDEYVIMSSETGVVDIEPENIKIHGRLE